MESYYVPTNGHKKEYFDESLSVTKMHVLYSGWAKNEPLVKARTPRQYRDIFDTEFNVNFFQAQC